jgi:hypothetical protein
MQHPHATLITRITALTLGLGLLATLRGAPADAGKSGKESALFRLDAAGRKIVGPAPRLDTLFKLQLVSVTVDQPQYWPNEKVFVKVLMPGRGNAAVNVSVQKRDANAITIGPKALDGQGVLVLDVLDGGKRRLQLGEYRVDVKTTDGKAQGHATFSVVEGSLGALSLAHEFRRLTQAGELERVKAGWFLGNAAGAGQRWGNGLSFKNELRVGNQPYSGEVTVNSRCMLPGCNGIHAGPSVKLQVKAGVLAATMNISGHSGPFQIEIVTPQGSLRHQFEGSSHVERDMVPISAGVCHVHRAGLAPYAGTTAVPGRPIFVDRVNGNPKDAFEIPSIIAASGQVKVKVKTAVKNAVLWVYQPRPDGGFDRIVQPIKAALAAGTELVAPVKPPYSIVTVGGFAAGKLAEGYAVVFAPAGLTVAIDAPTAGPPLGQVPVTLTVKGADGSGARVSGVLEVYDNRVASRSPATALVSAVGDAVRNVSSSLRWMGVREEPRPMVVRRSPRYYSTGGGGSGSVRGKRYAPGAMEEEMAPAVAPAPSRVYVAGLVGQGSRGNLKTPDDPRGEGEVIRQGERKVVAVERVQTDAAGRAVVNVTLPPQSGRVAVRFVAVQGLDFATAQKALDVSKKAYVEVRLPNAFVPGARLDLRLTAVNGTPAPLVLTVHGAGLAQIFRGPVPVGKAEFTVPWVGNAQGRIVLALADAAGKTVDRRELDVRDLTSQAVTLSRLELGGKTPVAVAAGETAVVYRGPGELLKGTLNNLITTMYSWFGHAEALSAQVAVRALVLAAVERRVLDDEGMRATLEADLERSIRDLQDRFFDPTAGLVRPFPGLAPNPLWSAWTARNLHAAVGAFKQAPVYGRRFADLITRARTMATTMDRTLKRMRFQVPEQAGYDPDSGLEVIPVEVNGKVLFRVLTDDAVRTFLTDRFAPLVSPDQRTARLAVGRALDRFRFLRAFERVGMLQYLTQSAKALWLAGPRSRAEFARIFGVVARGLILSQEPGLVQGPALTGGVYSTPMALVRFLELLLLTGTHSAAPGAVTLTDGGARRTVAFGERLAIRAGGALSVPAGAVIRIDRVTRIDLAATGRAAYGAAQVTKGELRLGEPAQLTITLDAGKDPLEYYAIVAVPTTTAIRQTGDILSDYQGQLIHGQQSTGAGKMQAVAVPFRGSRTLSLWIEGAYPGVSGGLIAVRHVSNPEDVGTIPMPTLSVK